MLIEETYITDTDFDGSQASKLLLMEKIIEAFTPLFSEEIDRKKQELRDDKQDYAKLKDLVKNSNSKLKDLEKEFKIVKKREKIIDDSEILMNHNVLFGKNKNLVKEILTNIFTMSIDELNKSEMLLNKLKKQHVKQII